MPTFSLFSKAQNLFNQYLKNVETKKDTALKEAISQPKEKGKKNLKPLKTTKSHKVAKMPVNKNFPP
jgi:hypothetical protein